jgi:hypothetical protein
MPVQNLPKQPFLAENCYVASVFSFEVLQDVHDLLDGTAISWDVLLMTVFSPCQ